MKSDNSKKSKPTAKINIVVILIILILAAAAVIVYLLTRNNEKDDDNNDNKAGDGENEGDGDKGEEQKPILNLSELTDEVNRITANLDRKPDFFDGTWLSNVYNKPDNVQEITFDLKMDPNFITNNLSVISDNEKIVLNPDKLYMIEVLPVVRSVNNRATAIDFTITTSGNNTLSNSEANWDDYRPKSFRNTGAMRVLYDTKNIDLENREIGFKMTVFFPREPPYDSSDHEFFQGSGKITITELK